MWVKKKTTQNQDFWFRFVNSCQNWLKLKICIQNWLKIDPIKIFINFWLRLVIFDKNYFQIKICIQNWFQMDSKLGFAFIFDSDFMQNWLEIEVTFIFDSDIWKFD